MSLFVAITCVIAIKSTKAIIQNIPSNISYLDYENVDLIVTFLHQILRTHSGNSLSKQSLP